MKRLNHSQLFLLFAVFATSLIIGCQPSKQAQRIETADSLRTHLETLNNAFAEIDYERHFQNRAEIMESIEQIEQYYKTRNDTMPRDIGMTVSDYRLVWKGYKRMEGEYGQVEQELEYTTEQIESLLKDLEHNALPDNLADRFLEEESKAVADLDITASSIKIKLDNTEQKYLEQKAIISQLIDSLINPS